MTEKRIPYHEEFAEEVIRRLEAGTAPWQKPWKPGHSTAPQNPVSGTVYRGGNRVWLSMRQPDDDPRWMTYAQAREIGAQVRKGERGTSIAFWQWTKQVTERDSDGRPVLDSDGREKKVTVNLERPFVRYATVFHASQIEGLEPHTIDPPAWEPVERGERILSGSGAAIRHDQADRAYYRPGTDTIHLPGKEQFPDAAKYYATALHELGHWTGHKDRLDRELGNSFGTPEYAREELRAEIASWMLGSETGVGHDPDRHAAYVQSWIKALRDDPYEIIRACRDAEHIRDYLLESELTLQQETRQTESPALDRAGEKEAPAMEVQKTMEKTYLHVPFAEKDLARKAGARWDKDAKLWFAPAGADLDGLQAWLPDGNPGPAAPADPQQEFGKVLADMGLDLGGSLPVMDGRIHRVYATVGKSGNRDGAYCGYLDGHPAGWGQNYKTGEKINWTAPTGHTLDAAARTAQRQEMLANRRQREAEIAAEHDRVAAICRDIWQARENAPDDHAYLHSKGVPALGVKLSQGGDVLVPLRNIDGELRGLQAISPAGNKQFMAGSEKKGCFHFLGDEKDLSKEEIILAEGYATGASLHMGTGKPVAVAFDAGNLEVVAKKLREKYPEAKITIAADNDHASRRNIGVESARKAAQAVGGVVKVPTFTKEEKARGLTDFNDLHQSRGLSEVRKQMGISRQRDEVER